MDERTIRTSVRATEANEWALVLTAAGIPHRLVQAATGWMLVVPDTEVARGQEALDAYDAETRGEREASPPAAASLGSSWVVGLVAGALLLGFFVVTGPPRAGSAWFERGAGAAGPMLHGEPWRAVTALTLHVDVVHVLSNAVATALLLPPIVQRLGPGGAVFIVLMAGTSANLLAAAAQGPSHASVGASTATFAAIGILAAFRLRVATDWSRGKRWIVPVATLLLLAMLGASRGADVIAHALGVLCGALVGVVAAVLRRPLVPAIQWALVAAAAVTIAGAWRLALAPS